MRLRLYSLLPYMILTASFSEIGVNSVANEPVKVEVRETADGFQLLRGGEPFFVQGAV